jgi:hypothetical protein
VPVPGGPLTRHGLSLQLYAEEHDVFASAHDFGDCAHRVAQCDMTFWSGLDVYLESIFICFLNYVFPSCLDVNAISTRPVFMPRSVYSTAGTYSKVSERVWLPSHFGWRNNIMTTKDEI